MQRLLPSLMLSPRMSAIDDLSFVSRMVQKLYCQLDLPRFLANQISMCVWARLSGTSWWVACLPCSTTAFVAARLDTEIATCNLKCSSALRIHYQAFHAEPRLLHPRQVQSSQELQGTMQAGHLNTVYTLDIVPKGLITALGCAEAQLSSICPAGFDPVASMCPALCICRSICYGEKLAITTKATSSCVGGVPAT